jgi:hypothetical protein
VFPVRYGQTYRVELSFEQKTGRWIMSRIVIVILIYHPHKAINLLTKSILRSRTQLSSFGIQVNHVFSTGVLVVVVLLIIILAVIF